MCALATFCYFRNSPTPSTKWRMSAIWWWRSSKPKAFILRTLEGNRIPTRYWSSPMTESRPTRSTRHSLRPGKKSSNCKLEQWNTIQNTIEITPFFSFKWRQGYSWCLRGDCLWRGQGPQVRVLGQGENPAPQDQKQRAEMVHAQGQKAKKTSQRGQPTNSAGNVLRLQ